MPSEKIEMTNFVLERFSEAELPLIKQMIKRAQEACKSFIIDGIDLAMNRCNVKPIEGI
jgi:peptidyl-tRNA hydrolase